MVVRDIGTFRSSLGQSEPPVASPPLKGLWWAAKGDWDRAHKLVQDDGSRDAAWVHAYLHRVEGDLPNARYWYAQAGRPPATNAHNAEWDAIAAALIDIKAVSARVNANPRCRRAAKLAKQPAASPRRFGPSWCLQDCPPSARKLRNDGAKNKRESRMGSLVVGHDSLRSSAANALFRHQFLSDFGTAHKIGEPRAVRGGHSLTGGVTEAKGRPQTQATS